MRFLKGILVKIRFLFNLRSIKQLWYTKNLPTVLSVATMDDSNIEDFLRKCEKYTKNVKNTETYLQRLSLLCNEKRTDVIKTVISVVQRYQNERKIQLQGVFCITNFSIHNDMEDLDRNTLNKIVDILAFVIKSYPDDECTMRTAMLTLYDTRLLKDVDFSRCLKELMNYFLKSSNPELEKLALCVHYDLTNEIMTNDTFTFNFPPQYMAKLLSMIRPHANSKPINKSVLVALPPLTNITSDNLSACNILKKEGYVKMFRKMLVTFNGESEVVALLLAILYNVLEVGLYRQKLLRRPVFISTISQLLNSEDFSVSFHAAGVMAYLLIEMPICETRQVLVDQLHHVIKNWRVPQTEGMPRYRSFKTLYSLLQCTNVYSVQLYAAWCIRNSCDCDPGDYCKMLERENGLEILKKLEEDETTHPEVRNLCRKIFEVHSAKRLDNTTVFRPGITFARYLFENTKIQLLRPL